MNDRSGWSPYNKDDDPASTPHADLAGRVVAIGAICDFATGAPESGSSQSFSVREYMELNDGRHVVVDSRGFTLSSVNELVELEDGRRIVLENVAPARAGLTPESIRQQVLNVVLPDEGESDEAHPWSWLVEQALKQGIDVTVDDLKALPYTVVLTKQLADWLSLS